MKSEPAAEVSVFAAGSLRAALVDIARDWEAERPASSHVRFTFGASGLLKDRLEKGERADVFASANMEHPAGHSMRGRPGAAGYQPLRPQRDVRPRRPEPRRHRRQAGRAHARSGAEARYPRHPSRTLPATTLWDVFRRVEASGHLGAFAALSGKALQLTGGPQSPPPPADRSVYAALMASGQADLCPHLLHQRDPGTARRTAIRN